MTNENDVTYKVRLTVEVTAQVPRDLAEGLSNEVLIESATEALTIHNLTFELRERGLLIGEATHAECQPVMGSEEESLLQPITAEVLKDRGFASRDDVYFLELNDDRCIELWGFDGHKSSRDETYCDLFVGNGVNTCFVCGIRSAADLDRILTMIRPAKGGAA